MSEAAKHDWLAELEDALPRLGHRNWIVVADAAYPDQCAAGIRTIVSERGIVDTAEVVLALLNSANHVRPVVLLDAEIDYLDDGDSPGALDLRRRLFDALGAVPTIRAPHSAIIDKLDAAGRAFRVLLLKTPTTIPYTSVFIELDCGYWSDEAEARLRERVAAA